MRRLWGIGRRYLNFAPPPLSWPVPTPVIPECNEGRHIKLRSPTRSVPMTERCSLPFMPAWGSGAPRLKCPNRRAWTSIGFSHCSNRERGAARHYHEMVALGRGPMLMAIDSVKLVWLREFVHGTMDVRNS